MTFFLLFCNFPTLLPRTRIWSSACTTPTASSSPTSSPSSPSKPRSWQPSSWTSTECQVSKHFIENTKPQTNNMTSGYSDKLILGTSVGVSIGITLANVGLELVWKWTNGQNLISTAHTYMYMGMKVGFPVKPKEI